MRAFEGQVVWITGASSGIGAALAEELARRGARLVLSARDETALAGVAARCGSAVVVPLDLADGERVAAAAVEVWERYGPVDVVVHNAGLALRDVAAHTELAVDRRVMEVNFFGPVTLTKALLGPMLARGKGRFVVVSSLSGKYGVPATTAYAASKHALHGWFDSLRAEVHGAGLRVTLVVPGFVATDITRHALKGDGSRFDRQLDVHVGGMPPARCAVAIADAVVRDREEVAISVEAWGSVLLHRLFPRLWRWVIRSHPLRAFRRLRAALGGRGAAHRNLSGEPHDPARR